MELNWCRITCCNYVPAATELVQNNMQYEFIYYYRRSMDKITISFCETYSICDCGVLQSLCHRQTYTTIRPYERISDQRLVRKSHNTQHECLRCAPHNMDRMTDEWNVYHEQAKHNNDPHPNEIISWHQVMSIIYDIIPHDKDLYFSLTYCIR